MVLNDKNTTENNRLKQLKLYDLLNLRKLPEFDIFAEAICLITKSPASLVAIMEEDIQTIQSCIMLDLDTVAREDTMCKYAIESKEILIIEDTHLDSRALQNQILIDAKIRFYISVPLIDEQGHAIGTICAVDFEPKKCTPEQIISVKKLAESVTKIYTSRKKDMYAEFFLETFNITNNLIAVLDTDLNFIEYNPSFYKIFNKSQDLLMQSQFDKLFDLNEETKNQLKNIVHNKSDLEFKIEYKNPENELFVLNWQFKLNSKQNQILCFGRNITTETIEKDLLERSERKFRQFFDNGLGLMCMHDLQGNILEVNKKGYEVLQYTIEETKKLNLKDLLIEDHQKLFTGYIKRVVEKNEDSGVMGLKTKQGEEILWLYQSLLVYNDQNEPYIITSSLNITERIKLEKDLIKTTELLEQINSVSQVGGWEMDLENNKLMWSEMTKKIHEVPLSFQPKYDDAINYYTEDSRKILEAKFKNALEKGENFDLELQLIKSDQSVIWVRTKGIPKFENGVCKRIFGIIQDIDASKNMYLELNKRKSMLQAFINDVPASVAMFDNNLNYISVSNRWLDEFKLKYEEIKGKNLFHLYDNYPENRHQIYKNALKGIPYKNENEVLHLSNIEFPQNYNIEVLPWHLSNEEIGGIIIFIDNITEEVRANEELKEAKRTADLASKAKTEFLANMSHEIRTPLNGVIGFSDLLLKTPVTEVQTQYLNYINESGNTLLHIINDILDLSKIESGKLELNIDSHNIYDLTNQVTNVVLFQVQQKNIELLLNIEQGLPTALFFDDIRLKQVLINLLGNAVKFTEAGEIELKIEQIQKTNENIKLKISVRDSGIGIPLDKQKHIFNAFTQEDSSVSKRYGGTGLGLTISNNILKYMGSSLSINSEVGKGATFFFEIDLKYNENQSIETELIPIKKVLIVDDNDKNRIIIQEMLRFKNIETVQAASGLEALQILMNGEEFDMILVDFYMPIFSGIETMNKIKEMFSKQDKQAPIIVLHTSSQEQEVLSQINELNETYCLMKPVNATQLYKTIQKILAQNASENNQPTIETTNQIFEKSLNVLVADDNTVNLILNKKIMSNLAPNAILTEVTDGEKAILACQNNQFDLILMDVQMPNLDGIQATQAIRQIKAYDDIPIIGVTAGNILGEKEKCINAGMNDVLTKPIRQDEVKKMLIHHLTKNHIDTSKIVKSDYFNEKIINDQLGDDPQFKQYFLKTVIDELNKAKQQINTLQPLLSKEQLIAYLHKLKGTTATAGLFKLAEMITEFEILANDEQNQQSIIAQLIPELETALAILLEIKE